MTTHDPIPARLAALKTATTPELKEQWRDLFGNEPPPFNRRYLESRLAYRIQELAYGGLKPETVRRLERLGEQLDGGDKMSAASAPTAPPDRRHAADPRVAGRRACRHRHRRRLRVAGAAIQVAVRHRPRHHRHALERLGFFGLKNRQGADMTKPPRNQRIRPQAALRGLHAEILRGRAGAGVQHPPRPARGLRGVHRQPALRGLGAGPRSV